ncbi:MAG: DNA cytosine methyltransferase [Eubacteriaceae bacterium]
MIKQDIRFGIITIKGIKYQLVDIGMRMLTHRELFLANGFPENYIIDRDADGNNISKISQVAKCGNAVPPKLAEVLIAANVVRRKRFSVA